MLSIKKIQDLKHVKANHEQSRLQENLARIYQVCFMGNISSNCDPSSACFNIALI